MTDDVHTRVLPKGVVKKVGRDQCRQPPSVSWQKSEMNTCGWEGLGGREGRENEGRFSSVGVMVMVSQGRLGFFLASISVKLVFF